MGGEFNGIEGVTRAGVASIDLDSQALEPWTAALPPFTRLSLATDGTWIFGRTLDSRYFKIHPVSGAVVGEHRVSSGDVILTDMRVAGGELIAAVSERFASAQLGAISIADWSYRELSVTFAGGTGQYISAFDVAGDTIYVAGPFAVVNGVSRPYLAAVHRVTGVVLPWRPSPDADAGSIAASGGRLWVSGRFLRIGGLRRRGLAELDPVTGHALAWNPDVPVGFGAYQPHQNVGRISFGPDGLLYTVIDSYLRPTVSGQATPWNVVFSPVTGRRLPWRPAAFGFFAILPDCLLVQGGCLRRAISSPADLAVEQSGASITLRWTLPTDGPPRTGLRLEVGSAEGRTDLLRLDLAPTATSYTAVAPPGSYFARVRSLAGIDESLPTPDVSFAVGRPAAPLDVTAVAEGTRLTVQWTPPSTFAPAAYVLEAGSAEGASDFARVLVAGGATSLTIDAPAGRYWGRLVSVDAAGGRTPGGELLIDVAATANYCGSVRPEPPEALIATVTGSSVTLTWQQPYNGPLPSTQRVVAGTAPGLDNLGAIQVASDATSFTTIAPPGTYHVRVLAFNDCGGSFSDDVQVVVP
ncbi:MAG TPA: fibronectin type III domain-containing protein [Vicinamibacterales bacterium]|nr:fibronectin type III domain-containing protein [Vicinamibacterales bacterium]